MVHDNSHVQATLLSYNLPMYVPAAIERCAIFLSVLVSKCVMVGGGVYILLNDSMVLILYIVSGSAGDGLFQI